MEPRLLDSKYLFHHLLDVWPWKGTESPLASELGLGRFTKDINWGK